MKKYIQDLDELNENEIKFTRDDIFDNIEFIDLIGMNFVLTGTFTSGKRKDIEELIKSQGGIVQKSLIQSTNYLVVGEITSNGWKFGNYGTKINKALKIKNEIGLKIIPEQVLMKSITGNSNTSNENLKDEIFEIFLNNIESKRTYLDDFIVDENGEYLIHDLEQEIDNYYKYIINKLNKAKYVRTYFPLLKYAYEQLSNEDKKIIDPILKEKLESYISKSLSFWFQDIKNNIDSYKRENTKIKRLKEGLYAIKENFKDFYNTKLVQKQIEKFEEEMNKYILDSKK